MRRSPLLFRFALCSLCVVLAVPSPGVLALEKEGLSISFEDPVDEADYTPIPASAGGINVDPASCRTDVTCDTIPIELDPTGFPPQEKTFLQVVATLSWDAQDAEGTAVPDLDLYLYDDTEENEIGNGASSAQPERAGAEWAKRDVVTLYATVVNFAGGPSAYHLQVEAQGFEIKEIPKFTRPTATTSAPVRTPAPTLATPVVQEPASAEPRTTPKPVVTPGPDGPSLSVDLQALDVRATGSAGGVSWWVILASVVGVAALGGTATFFVFRRIRPRRA